MHSEIPKKIKVTNLNQFLKEIKEIILKIMMEEEILDSLMRVVKVMMK